MTKQDLINEIADQLGTPKTQVRGTIDAFCDSVAKALSKGEDVTLTGFGTFRVYHRKARTGRNPRTGATLQIPAANVPKFRPGKALKDAVR